jgi:[protein-PII] uridylyltransferase
LARLTAVIDRDGLDIAWAKVTTLGSSVVDVFGLVVPKASADAAADHLAAREELERELYAVLPAPPPAKPVSEAG